MSVVVLGVMSSPILGQVLKALLENNVTVSAVLLDKKDWGLKEKTIFNERTAGKIETLDLYTLSQGRFPFYFVENHNSPESIDVIKKMQTRLLINASTPRILKSGILRSPKQGVLNVHPGLLPQYRGCCCPEWAVWNNDPLGNTVHFMEEGIDEGPIISSEAIQIVKGDGYVDMRTKLYQHSFSLLAKAASQLLVSEKTRHDYQRQPEGAYYAVMPNEKIEMVKHRLEMGQYRYQV